MGPDFHSELFPVHSPLLRESYLVSFPPLTYMLKFSGFADLTSCLYTKPVAGQAKTAMRTTDTTEMHEMPYRLVGGTRVTDELHASRG